MTEPTETQTSTVKNTKTPAAKRKGFFLLVFFLLALLILSRHEPVNTIDCTPEIIASNPDVIMLGAWWCSYCYQAKKYFQRNDISYCEYDMENTADGRRLYEEHGSGAVPILLIGKYQLNGFSEQQIETALKLLDSRQPALNTLR
jgi:glutaredoxin